MSRAITCVALDLTTVCNRACKDCCAGINMGLRPAIHHDKSYFQHAGRVLHGIERLHVTGGEPLTHPQFDELAPQFREMFGCNVLTLQTNGFQARKHAEALKHFDRIYPSQYGDNPEEIAFLLANYTTTMWPDGEAGFTPRSKRGTGKGCFRGQSDTVAFANGRLFGCCVAPGIPGAVGIEPARDWRQDAAQAPLPCSDCWFSE